jgi:Helix-turn-helix domain
MCEHGSTVDVDVTVHASHAHEGANTVKTKPIDRCIASIVSALEAAGVVMLGSCCGHGEAEGQIALADGRRIIIQPAAEGLRRLRVDHALHLREVATAASLTPRHLSDIEHGRALPTEDEVTRIRLAVRDLTSRSSA